MSQTANEQSTENAPKGGKKKLIIIGFLILVLAGSGGGFYYWRTVSAANAATEEPEKKGKKSQTKKGSEDESETDAGKDGEKKDEKKDTAANPDDPLSNAIPDDSEVKKIIEIQPFIVNLADSEQARYLRMTVSLGVGGEEKEEKADPIFTTRVRNAMLAVLSNKKSEEILTIEGKKKLRSELLNAAQAASEEPEVLAIYITDFIVQL